MKFKADELSQFLVNAKIVTYASGSDEFTVNPLWLIPINSSSQTANFSTEIFTMGGCTSSAWKPSFRPQPIWGMSYYGGVFPESSETKPQGCRHF